MLPIVLGTAQMARPSDAVIVPEPPIMISRSHSTSPRCRVNFGIGNVTVTTSATGTSTRSVPRAKMASTRPSTIQRRPFEDFVPENFKTPTTGDGLAPRLMRYLSGTRSAGCKIMFLV
jgi:hypothetical protein